MAGNTARFPPIKSGNGSPKAGSKAARRYSRTARRTGLSSACCRSSPDFFPASRRQRFHRRSSRAEPIHWRRRDWFAAFWPGSAVAADFHSTCSGWYFPSSHCRKSTGILNSTKAAASPSPDSFCPPSAWCSASACCCGASRLIRRPSNGISTLSEPSHERRNTIRTSEDFSAVFVNGVRGDCDGRGIRRCRRGGVFLQSEHARILSHLPVSPIDRVELSGLRRDTRGLRAAARKCCARAEGQRAVRRYARGGGRARHLVCGQTNPAAADRGFFDAEIFVGDARRRRDFHGVAEPAGVCVSFTLTGARAARPRVKQAVPRAPSFVLRRGFRSRAEVLR